MKKPLAILFILLVAPNMLFAQGLIRVNAESIIIKEPQTEVLDLVVNGTTPTWVNITKTFSNVQRIIFHMDFIDNVFDWNVFAGEADPLTNGFGLYYNDISLFDNQNITENDEFGHFSFDLVTLEDQANPQGIIILGRLSIFLFQVDGLVITSDRTLGFYIQDDMTVLTSLNEFTMTIEGYYLTTYEIGDASNNSFDLLATLEHIWNESSTELTLLLLIIFGGLLTWVGFKKLR